MRGPGTALKAPILLLALLLGSLFAGCLGIEPLAKETQKNQVTPPAPPAPPPVNYTAVKALVGNLTCQAPNVSLAETSANVKHIRSVAPPASIDLVATAGEIDANPNGTAITLAKRAAFINRGYESVNATEPTSARYQGSGFVPRQTGYYNILDPNYYTGLVRQFAGQTYDVKYSTDGQNALVGLDEKVAVADTSKPFQPQVPSGGRGYYFYGFSPDLNLPNGFGAAYRISILSIGGYDYFFVAPGAQGTSILVGRILGTGTYARPELVKVFPTGEAAYDVFATRDAASNESLLYVALGTRGVAVYNVDDPANAQLKTKIVPPTETAGPDAKPAHYTTVNVAWQGGRRIMALGAEAGSGEIRVFNVTQLNRAQPIGTWSADGKLGTPTSKVQMVNGTLLAAAGPFGIVGFDLSKAQGPQTMPLALHYQPPPTSAAPSLRDLVVRNGLLFASDDNNGLHVAALGCFPIGDPSFRSYA